MFISFRTLIKLRKDFLFHLSRFLPNFSPNKVSPFMILIVDDDIAIRTSLKMLLKQNSFESVQASNEKEALHQLNQNTVNLILLDLNFSRDTSGKQGLAFIQAIRKKGFTVPIIIITAWGSIELAVKGMNFGASDFISKPWENEHLLKSIKTLLNLNESENISLESRKTLDETYHFEKIIGSDPSLLTVLETISRVAKTDASVLILGESGTGKELVAEAIHNNSKRSSNSFVKVNLGGVSQSLFESEMFGHKKGAFTDAKSDRVGRFKLADKGSIFLDEIGELSLSSQVKLLRVLQEQMFEPLGSSKTEKINVRVISATNKNLSEMVEDESFREDLFYRLNLIIITLPALRERKDDIPILVNHFINNLKEIYARDKLSVSRKALNWLKDLPWKGNIRELKNIVERTVLVSTNSVLGIDDFSIHLSHQSNKKTIESLPAIGTMTLDEMEKSMILKAMEFHKKNMSRIARSLGLSRAALYRRVEKYGIELNED